MENQIDDLLSYCSKFDLGAVILTDAQRAFFSELNNEILFLCKSLPESIQIDALSFLIRYLGAPFGHEINFFRGYYVPAWSIIFWLIQTFNGDSGLKLKDVKYAKSAHSMAMFLHALDDHLHDKELPVSHLAMLIRSQSWMIMNVALDNLAREVEGGVEIYRGFINDYYSGICSQEKVETIDSYCDLFRKHMATWLIVPTLMTKKIAINEKFTGDIQTAYESFGIAWRLLDDINDIETDMMKGVHSSIYICLPENIKYHWDKDFENKDISCQKIILNHVRENLIISRLKKRIVNELDSAASIAEGHNLTGLADELRCLLSPLRNSRGPYL